MKRTQVYLLWYGFSTIRIAFLSKQFYDSISVTLQTKAFLHLLAEKVGPADLMQEETILIPPPKCWDAGATEDGGIEPKALACSPSTLLAELCASPLICSLILVS